MSSREVMEDDPDRWYKMVLEDEQEMKSLDGSEEQRARAKEWQMIVKEFSFLTYESMMKEDEEELAQHAWAGSDDNIQDRLLKKRYDAYKWIVYGIKPYYLRPEYIHRMERNKRIAKDSLAKSSPRRMPRGSEGLRPARATPPTQAWSPSELGWSTGKASKVS